jgi:hypothetical protein
VEEAPDANILREMIGFAAALPRPLHANFTWPSRTRGSRCRPISTKS